LFGEAIQSSLLQFVRQFEERVADFRTSFPYREILKPELLLIHIFAFSWLLARAGTASRAPSQGQFPSAPGSSQSHPDPTHLTPGSLLLAPCFFRFFV
jgi:hypothetical protein